jgi:hypothetical protein
VVTGADVNFEHRSYHCATLTVIINPDSVKYYLDSTLMIMQKVFQGTNTLLVIDDCANLADSKKSYQNYVI